MNHFFNVEDSNNGWFIGNFPKTVLTTPNFEVSYKRFKKGEKSDGHHHTQSTEYNLVVEGLVMVNNQKRVCLEPGCIFIYYPYEPSVVEFLEDSALVVIRVPSVNDKEYKLEKPKCSDSGKLSPGNNGCNQKLCQEWDI